MKRTQNRCLILFTEFFPFSDYHAYLNAEVAYLSKAFGKLIIVSRDTSHDQKFEIPQNARIYRIAASAHKSDFFSIVKIFFHNDFYRELKIINKNKYCRINAATLKILLASLITVMKYEKLLSRIYWENQLQASPLYIYSWWMNDYTLAFHSLRKYHGQLKLFSRVHSSDLYFFRHPYNYLPFKKQIIESLDAVFAISDHAKNYLAHHHHLDELEAKKIFVRRLGTRNDNRKEHFFFSPQPNFTLVSNSFITPLKRVELIASALLLIDNFQIRWIHFGDVYNDLQAFDSFRQKIQSEFRKKKNIKVDLKGYVENEHILKFYEEEAVDAIVNVSRFEGTAVSMIEAMSFGIPAIATNVGATNELIHEENGILLPEDLTPEVLAQTLQAFFSMSEEKKQSMRRASRKRWEENFNAEINYPLLIREFFL